MGNIAGRLARLRKVVNPARPVHYHVAIPDGDGVDYDGKYYSLAEFEAFVKEDKRKGGQWIEVTPESIERRAGL